MLLAMNESEQAHVEGMHAIGSGEGRELPTSNSLCAKHKSMAWSRLTEPLDSWRSTALMIGSSKPSSASCLRSAVVASSCTHVQTSQRQNNLNQNYSTLHSPRFISHATWAIQACAHVRIRPALVDPSLGRPAPGSCEQVPLHLYPAVLSGFSRCRFLPPRRNFSRGRRALMNPAIRDNIKTCLFEAVTEVNVFFQQS